MSAEPLSFWAGAAGPLGPLDWARRFAALPEVLAAGPVHVISDLHLPPHGGERTERFGAAGLRILLNRREAGRLRVATVSWRAIRRINHRGQFDPREPRGRADRFVIGVGHHEQGARWRRGVAGRRA